MIIRWVCEKDKKAWMYPIEKCIYCKGPIKKQISSKAKVIGITKVNISSPLHPIIPYNVILLEDEYGNRMPKKTFKDYKIGDKYIVEKAKKDSAVVITKIKYDLGEALKQSISLLNSFDIKKGDKVLIKPSIIEPAYTYQAVNTNPRLLDEVIKFLKESGISDIVVGEQSLLGNDVGSAAKKSEILDVCLKHKVNVADLSKAEYIEKYYDGIKLEIAKEVFERKIINIPAMKTNSQIGISGAVENMVRVTSPKTQKSMFDKGIEKTLPMLIKVLPKFVTIGDATSGMHGNGPTSMGEPAFLNILYVSNDPAALDAVFAETGMFQKPLYLEEAQSIGAGISDIKEIEIAGDELDAAKLHLKPADKDATPHSRIKLIDGQSNPYIFNTALAMSSSLIGVPGYEVYLAIGKHIKQEQVAGKKRIVAYGSDAISRLKEIGAKYVAEISEDSEDIEKMSILKKILEDPKKEGLNVADKLTSKLAVFGVKIKKRFS
ncbi:DUF362 domain-containing protein [Candidatus Woesearchaeota archaeon]|nr:DUF362 domain-containing protein [Candidatus Woesearchaeota archaeon]